MKESKELIKIIKRIELEISKTPTGELRNLLCDTNIIIQTLVTDKLTANKLTANKLLQKRVLRLEETVARLELIEINRQYKRQSKRQSQRWFC